MKNNKLLILLIMICISGWAKAQTQTFGTIKLASTMDQIRFEILGESRYFIMSKPASNISFGIYSPDDGGWFTYWKTNSGNMVITKGNLGIGTDNPTSKLSVNGDIKAHEVNVSISDWADHVFNPGYKLLPLTELENFIQKNGHLPNVPTEKDVMQDGVNLAEMNVKLLEKVEELTLYLLELHKKNEELDQLIQELLMDKNGPK